MSDAARQRLRLWLRSEQALGLRSVPVPASFPALSAEPAGLTPAAMPARRSDQPDAPAADPDQPLAPAAGAGASTLFPGGDPTGLLPPDPGRGPFDTPPLVAEEKRLRLLAMDENEVRGCTRCRLSETRTKTVFGEGDADAAVFFIGEGPGENEDRTGRPFVGKAGQLLDRMIAAMGLARDKVYIANTVKCRPPGNREPAPDEVATCTPYLVRQLEVVRPRVIVTLGRPATQYMLQTKLSMSRLRGQWQEWRGIKLMPTFHPAYVLRQYTEAVRKAVWEDLRKVMAELGLPEKQGRE